jgi:arylsulfatase A-like enzyme
MPYTAVHLPLKEPEAWVARVPAGIQGEVARHYAASVMHLDDAVGQILAALEKKGCRENTLVVFTSDNGGSTVENNDLKYPDDNCPNGKLTGNNAPFRGQKGDLYEGGTRVPTLVSWPGRVKPGKADSPVQIIDWMPTLAALAGYSPERDLNWDGVDLTALLTQHTAPAERPLYALAPGGRARSLRLGDWKLIARDAKQGGHTELFNLAADPSEKNNLAASEPGQLQKLMALMEQVSARDRDAVAKD